MVELAVALAVALIMILFLVPPLLNYLTRIELEQAGRQTEIMLRRARQKAITLQVPVRVQPEDRSLLAFADLDNDATFNNADEQIDRLQLSTKVEWVSTGYTAVFRSDGSADTIGFFPMRNRDGAELRVHVSSLATGNVKIEKLY